MARPVLRLAVAAQLAVGSVLAVPAGAAGAAGAASPAPGAAPVQVRVGATTAGVDATLVVAGAITGHIYGPKDLLHKVSGSFSSPTLTVFDSAGTVVARQVTGIRPNHRYSINHVPPGTGDVICLRAPEVAGVCGSDTPWYGGKPPATAPRITVRSGEKTTNVAIDVRVAGGVTGVVRSAVGRPLEHAEVYVTNLDDGMISGESTSKSGRYAIRVPGSSRSGFSVCAIPPDAEQPSVHQPATGYQRRCWKDSPALGRTSRQARPVHVSPAQTRSGIDITLPVGGALSGKITSPDVRLDGTAHVELFTSHGHRVASTSTNRDGIYHFHGLPPASADHVCVASALGNPHGAGREASTQPRCLGTADWSGGAPPPRAAQVRVRAGQRTRHVDITIPRLRQNYLQVRVIAADTKLDLYGDVEVFAAHRPRLLGRTTGEDGHVVVATPSRAGYRICLRGANPTDTTTDPSPTGYAPTCLGAAWDGGGPPPKSATIFPGKYGDTNKLTITAPVGGAITGTAQLTPSSDSGIVEGIAVDVYDQHGYLVSTGIDNPQTNPQHTELGLPSGAYRVCFHPTYSRATPAQYGYVPQCYNNVAWNGKQCWNQEDPPEQCRQTTPNRVIRSA